MNLTLEGTDHLTYWTSEISEYRHHESDGTWEKLVGPAWVIVSETVELDRAANDVVRAEGLLFKAN
jgi:hypothetical protein